VRVRGEGGGDVAEDDDDEDEKEEPMNRDKRTVIIYMR
jgi:hypothetical protein